jgi:RNA polymerase sigma factor (sigma-70 family)
MPDGSVEYLTEVYQRYLARLCGLAERLIGERLRRQYSAEDAAHSALASFYRGIHDGRFRTEPTGNLWSLLATILRHKVQKHGRRMRDELQLGEPLDPCPSHEDAVELADAIETALAHFKPRHVEICRLYYHEGMGVGETAASAGCSRWTVRRVLERFSQQLRIRLEHDTQQ